MGLPLLFGSLLIAVGPAAIFFIITVSRRPYLMIVSLLGFLQGIIALLISGIVYSIWNIWSTPSTLVISVINILACECLRPAIYKAVDWSCKKLNQVEIPLSITSPSELYKLSLCIGMGNGFLNVLSIALVPLTSAGYNADYYISTCSHISIYIVIAVESLCIMPMHVIWTYLTMREYPSKKMGMALGIAVWHLAISFITQLNQLRNGCIAVLVIFILCAITCIFVMIRLISTSCNLVRPVKKTN